MEFYNMRRDPGEKRGEFYPGLYAVTPLQNHLKSHMLMIRKFPHRTSKTIPRRNECREMARMRRRTLRVFKFNCPYQGSEAAVGDETISMIRLSGIG